MVSVLAVLLSPSVAVFMVAVINMFMLLLLQAKLARAQTVNVVVHIHCTCGGVVPGAERIEGQEEPNDEQYEAAEAAGWETPVLATQYQRTRSKMVV